MKNRCLLIGLLLVSLAGASRGQRLSIEWTPRSTEGRLEFPIPENLFDVPSSAPTLRIDGAERPGVAGVVARNADGSNPRLVYFLRDEGKGREEGAELFTELWRSGAVDVSLDLTAAASDAENQPSREVVQQLVAGPRVNRHKNALWWLLAGWAILLLAVGFGTSLLRDPAPAVDLAGTGSAPARGRLGISGRPRRTYSLARVQFVWWTSIIAVSMIFIYVVTGSIRVPGFIVLLWGLSSGTVVASSYVRSRREDRELADVRDRMLELETRRASIESSESKRPEELSEIDARMTHLVTLRERIRRPSATVNPVRDLLADSDGVQWHRLQVLVWNLMIGVLVVLDVHADLAFPDLPASILGLSGASAGAYVASKGQEPAKGAPVAGAKAKDGGPPRV